MAADGGSPSRKTAASVAGWSLVLMALVAVLAVSSTQGMVVQGDADGTAARIASQHVLFQAGSAAWLLVALLDLLVAVALYAALAPVNRRLALLAAAVRIVYAAILVAGVGGLLEALRLVESGASGTSAQVMLALDHFSSVWTAGLVLFGVHLGLVAALLRRSGLAPRVIGALLWLASASYVIGELAKLVAPALGATLEPILAAPEAVGELAFAVWLIARARVFSAHTSAPMVSTVQGGAGDAG